MDTKRKNFSGMEIQCLLSCVNKYKSILLNKKTNAASNEAKQGTWKIIEKDYNRMPYVCPRKSKQLQNAFKNYKRKAAKNKEDLDHILKTAGDSQGKSPQTDEVEGSLLTIETVKSLNPYGSNFICHKETEASNSDFEVEFSYSPESHGPKCAPKTEIAVLQNERSATEDPHSSISSSIAFAEQAKAKKTAIEQEHSLKVKFLKEEHSMRKKEHEARMALYAAQLGFFEKLTTKIDEPNYINLNIINGTIPNIE